MASLHSKFKEKIARGLSSSWAATNGIVVTSPETDSEPYDQVYHIKHDLAFLIQVKFTSQKSDSGKWKLRTEPRSGKGNTRRISEVNTHVDGYFIATLGWNMYYYPIKHVSNSMVLDENFRVYPYTLSPWIPQPDIIESRSKLVTDIKAEEIEKYKITSLLRFVE